MYLNIKSVFAALLFIAITPVFFSCNPDVDIPAYIYIEDVDFSVADRETYGTASHKIPFVLVSVDGTDVGSYQLPALVPVIASGQTTIRIGSGIELNGLSAQRVEYPFYTSYSKNITLAKTKVDTIRPTTSYTDSTKFFFIDNFEGENIFSSVEGAPLTRGNDENLRFHYPEEDNGEYGIITIAPGDTLPYFEIRSDVITTLPIDCLMELNYWFTEPVEIGLYCYTSSSQYKSKKITIVNLRASDAEKGETWKKVYINFTKELNDEMGTGGINMDSFSVYFTGNASDGKEARFLFDNIKLIYR